LAFLAFTGCEKQRIASAPANPPSPAAPVTPEESFQGIIETFRQSVEDVPIGFVMQDGTGGQTMMTGRNEVTHELVQPTNDGDPYKAVITVISQSRYSLQRPIEDSQKQDAIQSEQTSGNGSTDESGVQVFDSDVVSTPGNPSNATAGSSKKNTAAVTRKEDQQERKYELLFENGRWKLTTKLDPKTEGSIKLAFDRALATQS
jgi:hypothetical protein